MTISQLFHYPRTSTHEISSFRPQLLLFLRYNWHSFLSLSLYQPRILGCIAFLTSVPFRFSVMKSCSIFLHKNCVPARTNTVWNDFYYFVAKYTKDVFVLYAWRTPVHSKWYSNWGKGSKRVIEKKKLVEQDNECSRKREQSEHFASTDNNNNHSEPLMGRV